MTTQHWFTEGYSGIDDAQHDLEHATDNIQHAHADPAILYECGICSCLHPWGWDGDCREDANRYGDAQDYADEWFIPVFAVEVRSMDERVAADRGEWVG